MLLRRAPGIVAALLLASLTVLAPLPVGTTLMVCRMTGAVTAAPCAPADQEVPAPQHDAWVDPSCCDFLSVGHTSAPVDTITPPELSQPTFAVGPVHDRRPPRFASWPAPKPPAPPGLGPPIRQRTQTFLI